MKHGGARWKRIAAWTAGTFVALAAVWLIAINALLAFGGVEALVTREAEYSRTFLEFRRAWSVWPTRVHVYDATFRLDAHTYELEAELAEGTIDIRLLSLFGRRLHFEWIEERALGSGWNFDQCVGFAQLRGDLRNEFVCPDPERNGDAQGGGRRLHRIVARSGYSGNGSRKLLDR